jgi:hypothetical protein
MVLDHQDDYPSQWKAIESIAAKLSINHETLRQTDAGQRPGLTTDERARLKQNWRGVRSRRRRARTWRPSPLRCREVGPTSPGRSCDGAEAGSRSKTHGGPLLWRNS